MTTLAVPHHSKTSSPLTPFAHVPHVAEIAAMMDAFGTVQLQAESILKTVASEYGLGISDIRALYFINGTPDATAGQVREYLDLSSGACTTLLDRLSAVGFIERRPHPGDRRSSILEVAAEGVEAINRELQFYLDVFGTVVKPDQLPFMTDSLQALAGSLKQQAAARFSS